MFSREMVPVGVTAVFSGITSQQEDGKDPGKRPCQTDDIKRLPVLLSLSVLVAKKRSLATVDATYVLGGPVFSWLEEWSEEGSGRADCLVSPKAKF